MHMIHYPPDNRSMKLKASPVLMPTVTEHGVPGFRRTRDSIALAKPYEQRSSLLSDSGAASAGIRTSDRENGWALGYSCELLVWDGHSCPSLLTLLFEAGIPRTSTAADRSVRPTNAIPP
jgi:hypothetical protein